MKFSRRKFIRITSLAVAAGPSLYAVELNASKPKGPLKVANRKKGGDPITLGRWKHTKSPERYRFRRSLVHGETTSRHDIRSTHVRRTIGSHANMDYRNLA